MQKSFIPITIDNKTISENSPTYIIAEAGVNHNGNMDIAFKMIDAAVEAKVDAIKFQAFKTRELILENVEKAQYQKGTTGSSESQYSMLKKLEISKDQNIQLKKYCDNKNITFLTTAFDEPSLDELDELNLSGYKISSTDTTNLKFLKRVAQKGKPIILSTGMCYMAEVEKAVETIYSINKQIILLQCTANYPMPDNEANLKVINTYAGKFNIPIGYSDHSEGIGVAPYAVAMGAKVIEKHFTLDKNMEGPDQRASLNPKELAELSSKIRWIESCMGSGIKYPTLSENGTRKSLQKSIVASTSINKGEVFSEQNLNLKRTGGMGVSALYYYELIGKEATQYYAPDDIIK